MAQLHEAQAKCVGHLDPSNVIAVCWQSWVDSYASAGNLRPFTQKILASTFPALT